VQLFYGIDTILRLSELVISGDFGQPDFKERADAVSGTGYPYQY
jgi:hypothetical protein